MRNSSSSSSNPSDAKLTPSLSPSYTIYQVVVDQSVLCDDVVAAISTWPLHIKRVHTTRVVLSSSSSRIYSFKNSIISR